ncbi:MAG: hypothetical protein KKB74_14395 [Bacteroidetes bacterium]|nr:hypothetical protein [Bacteroidota bacterium]
MIENPEEIVDQHLLSDERGRRIQTDLGDSTWGQLILHGILIRKSVIG